MNEMRRLRTENNRLRDQNRRLTSDYREIKNRWEDWHHHRDVDYCDVDYWPRRHRYDDYWGRRTSRHYY